MDADKFIALYKLLPTTEQDKVLFWITNDQTGLWFFIARAIFSVIGAWTTVIGFLYLIYQLLNDPWLTYIINFYL